MRLDVWSFILTLPADDNNNMTSFQTHASTSAPATQKKYPVQGCKELPVFELKFEPARVSTRGWKDDAMVKSIVQMTRAYRQAVQQVIDAHHKDKLGFAGANENAPLFEVQGSISVAISSTREPRPKKRMATTEALAAAPERGVSIVPDLQLSVQLVDEMQKTTLCNEEDELIKSLQDVLECFMPCAHCGSNGMAPCIACSTWYCNDVNCISGETLLLQHPPEYATPDMVETTCRSCKERVTFSLIGPKPSKQPPLKRRKRMAIASLLC